MAKGKAKKQTKRGPSTGQLKRHYRQKAKRQKQLRQRDPTVRDKLMSGCMAVGLASGLIFIAAITWTCFFAE